MAGGSRQVVLAALAGNVAIAATKFAAFGFTRSTAMLTEAIHSLVDTADQILLLFGQVRAAKPADAEHPFGYGMETYFWSFIVALMIFVAGGIASIWQGLERLHQPTPMDHPWVNLIVLIASAVFEGSSFVVGYREYKAVVRGRDIRIWQFLQISKDPSLFGSLLEDGAALIGLGAAFLGVVLSGYLGLLWADGAASVAIGVLLLAVAVFLGNETRSLIAGEAAAPVIIEIARAAVLADPNVAELRSMDTIHLGPQSILVALTLRFRSGVGGDELPAAMEGLCVRLMAAEPRVKQVYLRPV